MDRVVALAANGSQRSLSAVRNAGQKSRRGGSPAFTIYQKTRAPADPIAKGRSDLMVVGDTTCGHVNAQTRRVLDLDERIAAMSVAHFWALNKHIIATS